VQDVEHSYCCCMCKILSTSTVVYLECGALQLWYVHDVEHCCCCMCSMCGTASAVRAVCGALLLFVFSGCKTLLLPWCNEGCGALQLVHSMCRKWSTATVVHTVCAGCGALLLLYLCVGSGALQLLLYVQDVEHCYCCVLRMWSTATVACA